MDEPDNGADADDGRRHPHLIRQLHHVRDEAIALAALIRLAIQNKDWTLIMELDTSKLDALGPRIDTVAAELESTISGDVAAAVNAANAAAATAQAAAVAAQAAADQAEAQAALVASTATLEAKIANLEAQAAAASANATTMAVSPTSASFAVGVASSVDLAITGATEPVTASDLPAGVTFDGVNLNGDTTTTAGTATVTLTDSSTPTPKTATVDVTIA